MPSDEKTNRQLVDDLFVSMTKVRQQPMALDLNTEDEADRIPSSGPLRLSGRPADLGWMGLDWSGRFSLASVPGGAYPALYRIFDAKTEQLLYIGETQNFGQRMKAHGQKNWSGRAPVVSYHRLSDAVLKVHLHEMENDLIAGYYEATGDAPELQFSGGD